MPLPAETRRRLAAALTSAQVSALAGGLLSIAGAAVIAAALPAFRRYRDGAAVARAPGGEATTPS